MTVYLRPLQETDLRRIYDWQRDPGLYDHLVGERRDVIWEQARDWMTAHWLPQGPHHRYALCADDEMVGCVYLLAVSDPPSELEFHIFIGEAAQRAKGMGTKALAEALRIAFHDLDATAVQLEVLESNAAARRIYTAAGFVETGCRPVTKRAGTETAFAMTLSAEAYRAR